LRVIFEGGGSYTVVNGVRINMPPGDVVLTPGSDWHWHGVEGDDACMWLGILDRPLTTMLEPLFQDYHPDEHEPMRNVDEQAPVDFPWAESLKLRETAMPEADGCFGARAELGTSKPALPTLTLHMQRLTKGQKTALSQLSEFSLPRAGGRRPFGGRRQGVRLAARRCGRCPMLATG
jgi:gentisate 1,2-dioxygenase